MKIRLLAFSIILILTLQISSFGGDTKLTKAQESADSKYVKELVKIAEFALKNYCYDDAEKIISKIKSIDNKNDDIADLEKDLNDKDNKEPKSSSRDKLYAQLKEAEKQYAKNLLKVAKAYYSILKKDENKEDREGLENTLYKIMFLDKSLISKFSSFKYAYTKEYGLIEVETYDHYKKGEFLINGEWTGGKKLKELEEKHNQFDVDPFIIESKNFRIKSSASYERSIRALCMAELTYRYVYTLFGKRLRNLDEKLDIHYFKSVEEGREMYKKKIAWDEFTETYRGYIAQDNDLNKMVQLCLSENDIEGDQVYVCHEITHLILYSVFNKSVTAPMKFDYWTSEASATFCENAQKLVRDYPNSKSRVYFLNFQNLVKDKRTVELKDLVYADDKRFKNYEEDTLIKCYAFSFAWGYFFINYDNGIYCEKFLDYICEFHKSDNKVVLFEKFMGDNYGKYKKEFDAFWKN